MAYEVIARKWRPQKFVDVVGQSQITKTLQNELLQSKLAHAYLFVGPRGIGKTTIARIFAKAINCERAPIDEPCCECDACKAIAEGNCIDLIEIDGASNNSVESMRTVCDEVLYAPVHSRYKVYIIDEVHMLSPQAWNALLKTIEEPPPHAKFLFATTEAHKVLPTVVSRCQRFDLRRITFKLIAGQLRKIATAEGIKISDGAIEVIARAADGGMRDAQSLLDQMIAFTATGDGEITEKQTLSVFGLTGVGEMENLLTAILTDDKPAVIASIHKIASHGKNLEKLFTDVLEFLRGVHICMLMPEPEFVLETGDDMIALYRKVGSASNADTVHKMLEQLSPVGDMLYRALNKQVFLETILLKAMRMAHAVEIKHLIAGLNQIRKSGNLSILENLPSVSETEKPSAQPIATPANAGQRPFVQSSASSGGRSETHEVQPPSQTVAPVASTPTVSSVDSSRSAPRQQMASPLSQKPNAVAEQQSKYAVNQPVNVSEQRQAPVVEPSQNVVSTTPETFPQTPASIAPQPPTPSVGGHDSDSESAKVTVVTAPVAHTPPSDTATSQQSVASSSNSTSTVNASSASLSKNTPLVEPFSETAKTEVANKPLLLTNPVSTTDSSEMPMTSAAASPASPAKPESANAVWHALTTEMERCSQPLLKAYMMEGMPKTFVDGKLSVAFDDEFETVHVAALLKEIALLETCLKRVVGNKAASLEIIKYAGIASPRDIPIIDDNVKEEIKQRAKQNPFVQSVLNLFEGEIVDVRG